MTREGAGRVDGGQRERREEGEDAAGVPRFRSASVQHLNPAAPRVWGAFLFLLFFAFRLRSANLILPLRLRLNLCASVLLRLCAHRLLLLRQRRCRRSSVRGAARVARFFAQRTRTRLRSIANSTLPPILTAPPRAPR